MDEQSTIRGRLKSKSASGCQRRVSKILPRQMPHVTISLVLAQYNQFSHPHTGLYIRSAESLQPIRVAMVSAPVARAEHLIAALENAL